MPSPDLPSWFRPDDPWLSTRMRQVAEIAAAEREIAAAVERALALFLATAHTRLLETLPAGRITAAAGVPDLAAWPEREQSWFALFVRFIRAVLAAIFARRFRAEIRSITITVPVTEFSDVYLDQVWQRLKAVPEMVFDEIREEIRTSLDEGDPAARTRARVADLLRLDAPTRRVSRQIARLQRTIDDPATGEAVRREARARLAALRRTDPRSGSRWLPRVLEAARTEAVAVLNAATTWAAEAYTRATGRRRWKQWWSTRDDRVRPAHRLAHGQARPVGEEFRVGGHLMRFPGDPLAPADLTTNCRCSLLTLSAQAGQRARETYERELTQRTEPGRALTAVGDPRGGVSMEPDATATPVATAPTEDDTPPVLAAGTLPEGATQARWRGVLAPLGVRSGDNRMLAAPEGAPQVRELPLPLLYQQATADAHDNSVVVGNITRVWVEDGRLMGEGTFDLGDDVACEVARKIESGYHRWVSVRLDNQSGEYRYYRDGQRLDPAEVALAEDTSDIEAVQVATTWRLMSATLLAEPSFHDAAIFLLDDDDEDVVPEGGEAAVTADGRGADPAETEPDAYAAPSAAKRERAEKDGAAMPGGRYPIEDMNDLRKAIQAVGRAGGKDGTEAERDAVRRHIIKRAKAIGKAFLVPKNWNADGSLKPSGKARIQASAERRGWYETVAAAVPLEPPAGWFADPGLSGPTKIRVSDEGRVYGHIAAWDSVHAAMPGVVPPHDPDTAYRKFHRHPVRTAEGTRVKTGPLAGHGHSVDEHGMPSRLPLWQVQRHYDDPDYVIADVVVGEDEHGIWCSGALRHGVTAYQVMCADRYSFSGDWRGGELLAACLVSVPGFHLDADDAVEALAADAGLAQPLTLGEIVPRMVVEDGEVVALVAAGVLPSQEPPERAGEMGIAVTFDPDPQEWGRQVGRGMFAGMREAEADAEAEREAERRRAETERRVRAYGQRVLTPHVDRLRARVEGGEVRV